MVTSDREGNGNNSWIIIIWFQIALIIFSDVRIRSQTIVFVWLICYFQAIVLLSQFTCLEGFGVSFK